MKVFFVVGVLLTSSFGIALEPAFEPFLNKDFSLNERVTELKRPISELIQLVRNTITKAPSFDVLARGYMDALGISFVLISYLEAAAELVSVCPDSKGVLVDWYRSHGAKISQYQQKVAGKKLLGFLAYRVQERLAGNVSFDLGTFLETQYFDTYILQVEKALSLAPFDYTFDAWLRMALMRRTGQRLFESSGIVGEEQKILDLLPKSKQQKYWVLCQKMDSWVKN